MNHTLIVDIETIKGQNHEIAMSPFIQELIGKYKKSSKKAVSLEEFVDEPADKYQEALRKAALSPIGGRLACIGVYEISQDFDPEKVLGNNKWHFIYSPNEREMLLEFRKLIKPQTRFVTYNGRAFDFPFLMFRAAIHRVPLKLDISAYNGKNYKGNDHIDLKIHLEQVSCLKNIAGDWSVTKTSLKEWIEYFGLGTKLSIADAEISIDTLIENQDIETLEEYTKNDVEKTKAIFEIFEGNFE